MDLQDSSHGVWRLLEAVSLLPEGFPLKTREILPPIMDPGMQEPGIGHMWHHIPLCTFCLKTLMVIFSRSISKFHITSQGHHSISKEHSIYLSWKFILGPRRPFVNTNHLGFEALAFSIQQYFLQGKSVPNQLSRHQEPQKSLGNFICPYSLYSGSLYGNDPAG
ncbi:hypothetical protein O181_029166 [Austropuccinia psidii MF-1]|uniref:Uncharacterized protein n=1 Tax=Austropuccinia psidii MF-1 TaxID=1389203 RepID=A0A9Q3CQJ7_9BASI|nr:hypothetical protein [Austropuccinia psidii MF-1]